MNGDDCRRCGNGLAAGRQGETLCEACDRHLAHERRYNGVRCDRCDGHGRIYGTFCDIQRAMNGRDTICPECGGSGRVKWQPEVA